jgi:hypothetical protein
MDIPVFFKDERKDTISSHQLVKWIEGAAKLLTWTLEIPMLPRAQENATNCKCA